MESPYAYPLSAKRKDELVEFSKDHLSARGVLMRSRDCLLDPNHATFACHMLLPSPFPRHCFLQARAIQTDINLLLHRVAHDHEFLQKCFKEVIKVDDFTRRLWNIYETVRNEGISQPISLALNRADYMLHCPEALNGGIVKLSDVRPKNVEFQTVASSLGGLSENLNKHHKFMLGEMGLDRVIGQIPDNKALDGLAGGIALAWELYGKESAVVLFLVRDCLMRYDHRLMERAIREKNPKIRVVLRPISELKGRLTLGNDKQLLFEDTEVAVVYFRGYYSPSHFKDEEDWSLRLLMERSRAIKCPNIQHFLVGMKKVQQMVATSGVVQQYLSDPGAVQRVTDTFVGFHSLDEGSDGDKSIAMALKNPHNFVVKPQREAGGNNIFGDDIPQFLRDISTTTERNAYILMDRIQPVPVEGYAVFADKPVELGKFTAELGIFGILVGSPSQILLNKEEGHILRTKALDADEASVECGHAALDTPCLV